ncbi:transposase domain-containing protein [Acetobacter fallax]|uniref:Transposase n=1 Tax=Acetobacter fallax TaxID=1737473 RepID=A0ABX0KEE8_9PROT|nr:transposase domain-containing protein [Acetobacter fallax]NHO33298.1 transposase [Acetobacter fallax]NHO36919.1 transposase [Acetobacter fallax]
MQTAAEQVPWLSAAELAEMALPGMPGTKQGVQARIETENWMVPEREGQTWRRREGRGGGYEFTVYALPLQAQAALMLRQSSEKEVSEKDVYRERREREDLWRRYDALPERLKDRAKKALRIIDAIEMLVLSGARKTMAIMQISRMEGVGRATIWTWYEQIRGLNRCDWLAGLAPHYCGKAAVTEFPEEAWQMLKADYLRLEKPKFAACFRRLQKVASERGWVLPTSKTLEREMKKLPPQLLALCREGDEALKRMFPAQKRDHSVFHALEAVNADGHKFDVFVRWVENGVEKIVRPVMVGFQDIYSGKILSWRLDVSENKECVRLAFGDLVDRYGIPSYCLLDNGRNFASKWLTGGIPNRYRFKVRDEEPMGILPLLGVEVHWATPYSGRSKPVERAWRDLAGDLSKHPRFAGAYTGNHPMAKPENYGSSAVPLDVFIEVVAEGIREHNSRLGRRSDICKGRLSFDQVFEESYARSTIVRATDEQRRLWLMAAEGITVNRVDGTISLEGNRFWDEFLHAHRGEKVVVRFDPQAMHGDAHVYRLDGTFLGTAPCVEKVGFNDKTAAQAQSRAFKAFRKATKEARKLEVQMSVDELAAIHVALPVTEETEIEAKVVRPFRPAVQGNAALALEEDEDALIAREEEEEERTRRLRNVIRPERWAG